MALSLSLYTLLAFIPVSLAFNCALPPIYIDIHRRAVHGTSVFQYGSFIGIGSPSQNQSLWPSLTSNHTTVAWVDFCANSDLPNCRVSTRGNFDPRDSLTWRERKDFTSLDSGKSTNNTMFGNDNIHLYTHYFESDPATQNLMPDAPVAISTGGRDQPGIVGLGQSSTLLQKLFSDNIIAGRTFGLYVGSGMDRAGGVINGSISLGAYDSGRFQGRVHTYPMDYLNPEPFAVQVQDIILNEPNGLARNLSLFDPTQFPTLGSRPRPFTARLTTDQYPMSFPHQITKNFISRLAAIPSGNPDGSLKLNKPFNGTMTIVLSDGFKVEIPSNVMYNVSGISPVAARDEDSNAPFYLSTSFLSQVYLMADMEQYTFHLAKVIAANNYVVPKTFCPKTVPIPFTKPNQSEFTKQGLIGAVIAAVVGGLIFIALSVFLAIIHLRRRSKRQQARDAEKATKAKIAKLQIDDSSSVGSKTSAKRTKFWKMGK